MTDFHFHFENFELLPGVTLSTEDKECLIDTLKVSIYKLDSLKSHKKETSKYCNDLYRLPPGRRENNDYYGNLTLSGRVFLYALYSLVKQDKYRFGYVYNFLVKELYARRVIDEQPLLVSDSAVRFANDFDYDYISSCVKERDGVSPQDCIDAVHSFLEQSKERDRSKFTKTEIAELVNPTCVSLEVLARETEKKLSGISNLGNETDLDDPIPSVPSTEDKSFAAEDEDDEEVMFYNPSILGSDYYDELDEALNPNYLTLAVDNKYFFQQWLNGLFRNSYIFDPSRGKMTCNYDVVGKAVYKIKMSFQDYLKRLGESKLDCSFLYTEDHVARWLKVTFECIDEAYDFYDVLDSNEFDEQGYRCTVDTIWFRNQLVFQLFGALLEKRGLFSCSLSEEIENVINYNFWPDTFRDTYDQNRRQVGLTPATRAVVFLKPNRKYFAEWLNRACNIFIKEAHSDDYDYSDLCERMSRLLSNKLSELFSDYIQRLHFLNPSDFDLAYAGLFWIFNTMQIVYDQLSKRRSKSRISCIYSSDSDQEFSDYFFLNGCFLFLCRTLSDFVEDNRVVHEEDSDFDPWRPSGAAKAYDFDDSGAGLAEQQEYEVVEVVKFDDDTPGENECGFGECGTDNTPVEGTTYSQSAMDELLNFYSGVTPAVKDVIKQFLIEKVGYDGGSKEFVYFAALDEKSILKVPEFIAFRKMFPKYDDDRKGQNYSTYLGASGRYLPTFRKSKKHKKAVESAIKEINNVLSIAGIKTKK